MNGIRPLVIAAITAALSPSAERPMHTLKHTTVSQERVASHLDSPLEAGIAAYWSGDYRDSVVRLAALCPVLAEDESVECFKYLGFGQVALGDSDGATRSFIALLARDAGHTLDTGEVSPKILAHFDQAKPAYIEQRFQAGKARYRNEEYAPASVVFDEVLALDPDHLPAQEYLEMATERLSLLEKQAELSRARVVEAMSTPDANRIYRLTSDMQKPELTRRVKPSYPSAARRASRQGVVILSLVVGRDGSVSEVSIVRGVSADIDHEAARAVSQWRYVPAELNGFTIAIRTIVRVEFRLGG